MEQIHTSRTILGMNAFEICERCGPFPSVMGVLGEHVRGEKLSS